MVGPKEAEFTGAWTKLNFEELHNLYSPDIIRTIKSSRRRLAGNIARMGQINNEILVGKPERKIPSRIRRRRRKILHWILTK
jgi:hypothetical protein